MRQLRLVLMPVDGVRCVSCGQFSEHSERCLFRNVRVPSWPDNAIAQVDGDTPGRIGYVCKHFRDLSTCLECQ